MLLKPSGVPFAVQLDGDLTQKDATIHRLGLRLSELDLEVKGTVRSFSKPTLDLTASAKPFRFDALARLLPTVGQTLAASKTTASGQGQLAAHVKGNAEQLDAALDLSLLGVKLDVPGTRLLGSLRLKGELKGNPGGDFTPQVLLDGNQATIVVKDVLNKTADTPLRLELSAARKGELLSVGKLDVRFAELRIEGDGRFDLAKGTTDARIDMPRLDLEKLARTLVALDPAKMRKGFVEAKIAVRGNPQKLDSMALALAPFAAQYAGSDVRGEVRVENLGEPRLEARLASSLLDIDALTGDAKGPPAAAKKAQAKPAPAVDDPSLKSYRLHALLEAKKVIVSQTTLERFQGEVELVDGVLTLKDCTFRAFGGTITASGTQAEIWRGRMPFKAKMAIKGLDLNQVLSAKTRYANTLFGTGDLDVQVSGVGFETADLERHLLGQLDVGLREGRFARASLTESVASGSLTALRKIPGLATKALDGNNSFRDLRALLEVRDGRMHLRQPVEFTLDGNRVQLEGAIGIARSANRARKTPLKVCLNGLGKDAAQIISRINGFTYVQTQFDYYTSELKVVKEYKYSEGEKAAVRCYGADDVREDHRRVSGHISLVRLPVQEIHQPPAEAVNAVGACDGVGQHGLAVTRARVCQLAGGLVPSHHLRCRRQPRRYDLGQRPVGRARWRRDRARDAAASDRA